METQPFVMKPTQYISIEYINIGIIGMQNKANLQMMVIYHVNIGKVILHVIDKTVKRRRNLDTPMQRKRYVVTFNIRTISHF